MTEPYGQHDRSANSPHPVTRYLYLARHGDAGGEGAELTGVGRRQAALLGRRLAGVPLAAVHHGPLGRAWPPDPSRATSSSSPTPCETWVETSRGPRRVSGV